MRGMTIKRDTIWSYIQLLIFHREYLGRYIVVVHQS
jgi:hypothetical protein